MPWRNGPHARAPAGDADRERLPRAIAARLARAGCIAALPASTTATAAANQPHLAARQAPPERWSREVFELIEWRRFEAVVEALFAQAGFETRSQAHGADGGIDIWLYSVNHADGDAPVSIVQCKQWMRHKVGVKEVRELRGVMAQHAIVRGQFVTTSDFSADARDFAESKRHRPARRRRPAAPDRDAPSEAAGSAAARRLRRRLVAADVRELRHQACRGARRGRAGARSGAARTSRAAARPRWRCASRAEAEARGNAALAPRCAQPKRNVNSSAFAND